MVDKWIQQAVDEPGRVHEYLYRHFGDKAFYKTPRKRRGNIKCNYLKRAIWYVKYDNGKNYRGLLNALWLARRFCGCDFGTEDISSSTYSSLKP